MAQPDNPESCGKILHHLAVSGSNVYHHILLWENSVEIIPQNGISNL